MARELLRRPDNHNNNNNNDDDDDDDDDDGDAGGNGYLADRYGKAAAKDGAMKAAVSYYRASGAGLWGGFLPSSLPPLLVDAFKFVHGVPRGASARNKDRCPRCRSKRHTSGRHRVRHSCCWRASVSVF